MSEWQPIATAPKDGSLVLCCWAGDPESLRLLSWKTNHRIERELRPGESMIDGMVATYFGDPNESDDYEWAHPEGFPTHWMPLPPVPDTA